MRFHLTATVAALLLPAMPALAQSALSVEDAYARSSNPNTGAAFMLIRNAGDAECHLTGGTSPAAERVETHTHRQEGEVMRMVEVEEGFTIPPQGEHLLVRGGDHIMLMALTAPLAQGDAVPVTLDFGDCGTLELTLEVDNDRAPPAGHGHAAPAPKH